MQTTQGNMLQSLRAVEAFIDGNAATLTGVVSTGARRRLTGAIGELAAHVSDQTGSALASQGSTKNQHLVREVLLHDHMAPLARIARADLPQTPQLAPLRMPRGRPTAPKLAAAANGMAQAAAPYASVFISAGLPTDFIAQLTGAADDLVIALDERTQSRGKRTGATKGLKDSLSDGRKVVHILDAFVTRALKNNAALLANWNSVKRVQRVGARAASAAVPAPTPTPASTPTPTPT